MMACISLLVMFSANHAHAAENSVVDTSLLSKGIVGVQSMSTDGKKLKVAVEKENRIYYYDLPSNGQINYFPLQMKNGDYKVSIYEQIIDNRYKPVLQTSVGLSLKDSNQMFLQSTQNVTWKASMPLVKKAHDLTYRLKGNEDKVKAVYGYVTKRIKYDYVKLKTVKSGYIPNPSNTYKTNKGICYDYSSLFAAMLRSQGIPVKLVTGYSTNVKEFHAWNEVYIKEKKKWVIIDTTVDASRVHPGIYKSAAQYKKLNEY
ncbi:transglutaminase-like domain-containing protein [Neobacillus sp. PS3-34]|uniref:transglutaminase-like domain-containing protein n=1 Tax=Neobacillus sp. PS3-34 TaxID=3070678 RepID=UPI0027E07F58|nr:transglutaminase-like domain-containing protein [Neobacillus sp. PS3-34]WML50606.1 transglutaminase-like domain-containing protein [Neobacillus sp. PS3-34]